MKQTKCIFALLTALLLLLASACTDNGTEGSKDTAASAEQSFYEGTSEEESAAPIPTGFDDGIAYGYHILGNSMYGDVMFAYRSENELSGLSGKIKLLMEYFDENSFMCKAYEKLDEEAWDFYDPKKGEKDVPLADFKSIYDAEYQCELGMDDSNRLNVKVYTYEEVRETDAPIYLFLEIVPFDGNTVNDIQKQYGIDKEQAVSIYRQRIIDALGQYGIYADGFTDIYNYDTDRAYLIETTADKLRPVDIDTLKYEDSVYKSCTHLFFSAYGKCEDIERLEAAVKSDENKLFKIRAMPAFETAFDTGKPAYVVEDPDAYAHKYYNRGGSFIFDLEYHDIGVLTEY